MPIVPSLLTAIVRVDGDALVMHVGEKPYVVTTSGPVELSSSALNLETMSGMIGQLLPADAQHALSEFGAVEHELPALADMGDRFTLVVARGGDDVWIELRRHRRVTGLVVPEPALTPPPPSVPEAEAVVDTPREELPREEESEPADLASSKEEPVATPELRTAPDVLIAPDYGAEPPASTPTHIETHPSHGGATPKPPGSDGGPGQAAATAAPGVVVPMTRTVRIEVPARTVAPCPAGVDRLLGIAIARGASVLCLTSQSRPYLKVDGEIRTLDDEPWLASGDVEAAVLELMPEAAREAHSRGEPAEWVSELEDIGRIRCTTFRDYRGTGALFHLSGRPMSAEQLGLPREIQALVTDSDGIILVAGRRGGGKSTLVSAFVDLINCQQSGYVITLERQIRIVHENRQALISQREVRGTAADVVIMARAALRENPDVLVIDDLNSPDVIQMVLDAAGAGVLVIVSVMAGSTVSALMRVIDLCPSEKRKAVQAVIAERLRGAVAQVLLRKSGGGRVAARELLLSSPTVASLIAEGQLAQLAVAMQSGRKQGMMPLNDALVALVQGGIVDTREAYRKADDGAALLTLLKRDGVDISFAERLA